MRKTKMRNQGNKPIIMDMIKNRYSTILALCFLCLLLLNNKAVAELAGDYEYRQINDTSFVVCFPQKWIHYDSSTDIADIHEPKMLVEVIQEWLHGSTGYAIGFNEEYTIRYLVSAADTPFNSLEHYDDEYIKSISQHYALEVDRDPNEKLVKYEVIYGKHPVIKQIIDDGEMYTYYYSFYEDGKIYILEFDDKARNLSNELIFDECAKNSECKGILEIKSDISLKRYNIPEYNIELFLPVSYINKCVGIPLDVKDSVAIAKDDYLKWVLSDDSPNLIAISVSPDKSNILEIRLNDSDMPDLKSVKNGDLFPYCSAMFNQRGEESDYINSSCRIVRTDKLTWIENKCDNYTLSVPYIIRALTYIDGKQINIQLYSKNILTEEEITSFTKIVCSLSYQGQEQHLKSISGYFGIEDEPYSFYELQMTLPGSFVLFDKNTKSDNVSFAHMRAANPQISNYLLFSENYAFGANYNAKKTIRIYRAEAPGMDNYSVTPVITLYKDMEEYSKYLSSQGHNIIAGNSNNLVRFNDEVWIKMIGEQDGKEQTYAFLTIHNQVQYLIIFNNTDAFTTQDKNDIEGIMNSIFFH